MRSFVSDVLEVLGLVLVLVAAFGASVWLGLGLVGVSLVVAGFLLGRRLES